ncbi:ATP-dependent helicase HrpB [Sulfurimicrobium lacus]|uniref:ATP-dependent helicase HrpB n=1 Tax=Sulfurimicrobium lacus TaxID=2715678 RepID=A0A6F8VCF2_9PROT|nr:ATP-dependent helicase HrpB [Sulfurimicrobium lacus]
MSELRAVLAAHSAVVLEAPPGAGKTTRIPLALLDEAWLGGQAIAMLEPRRLAARGAAVFMAAELGEEVGERIGYRVRFENRVSKRTRVEVVTEGILTRRLQHDPELVGVGLVIFDEFHERNLHSDLALALCRDAQSGLREDLKILVMSATLDGARIAALLGAPLVRSEGRSYPVEVRYRAGGGAAFQPGEIAQAMARAVADAAEEARGDILAFLPGSGEIRRVEALLAERAALPGAPLVHPLYGDLSFERQQAAIAPDPQGRRKVILATPIAETSLTIEGIATVIDSGWQRVPRFDPPSGLTRLETVRVSRASADQRAGRAGRLGPGVCLRLWNEDIQRGLVAFNAPEILEADLSPLALELARWGVNDVATLTWLDPPPAAALAQGRELLQQLDALDGAGRITALGREMAGLPLHPRLAHMLLRGREMGLGTIACDVAAVASERDPMRALEGERRCDFALRAEALRAHRSLGNAGARRFAADPNACAAAERAARQWRHLLGVAADDGEVDEAVVGLLLALAYPDRIAQRRREGEGRYLLANGRGARLLPGCAGGAPLLVAASLDGKGDEGRIFLAAALDADDLARHFGDKTAWQPVVRWDRLSQAVLAREERRLGALVLAQRPLPPGFAAAEMVQAMVDGVRDMGLESLPWDEEARQLQARIASLRQWQPDAGWPDLSDAALLASLEDWLAPYLDGLARRDHLARLDLTEILKARLDWDRLQQLESLAPTHIAVPSGSRKRLEYFPDGAPPVLAVKLQELFGLAQSPAVADGKVALMLHLLSPAQRPIQVTRDLKNFWDNTYPEVKKELKGRYPKHPWPDDPWNAAPTARAKPRS